MDYITWGLSLLILMIAVTAQAQTERFEARQYIADGDTLNYRIAFPDYNPSETYPVVLFLHGAGERGNDNEAQLKWGVQNFVTDQVMMAHSAIVIAPQCPANSQWSNFEGDRQKEPPTLAGQPARPLEMTMQVLDQVIENSAVDTTRIYITGLSMGGFGTWDALARWPERFAAAVPVCGGGAPSTVEQMVDIPIWAFHGAQDATVPPELSREMIHALQEVGAKPGYTEYPGVGHFSWIQAYSDPYMMDWLFSQQKGK